MGKPREFLLSAFYAAVNAAQPEQVIRKAVQTIGQPRGRTFVVGAGKAAASMAKAFEDSWAADLAGVVVTRYGHATEKLNHIELLEASHPVPDLASEHAGKRILQMVSGLTNDDLVIVLLSGGASALMVAPTGVSFEEKIFINQQLLKSGADITEMNIVRKHLSGIKGGHLALAAAPAQVFSLIVSDVVGDDVSTIASGPTAPDATSCLDAIRVMEKYKINSEIAMQYFQNNQNRKSNLEDPAFKRVKNNVILTNAIALESARVQLEQHEIKTQIWSDSIVGEAKDAAKLHAQKAQSLVPGTGFLSGGETTVTVRGTGRGGRNCEFLLALAIELQAISNIYAIACDTDGIDGVSEAAGAILTPDSLQRAAQLGLNAQAMLDNNDAYSFFAALGDLVITGPTGTNVNDFRVVLRAT